MNWENILTAVGTGVLTGVIASAITGYFGLLYAFRQFRTQRAFDRQLEWYERTLRALGGVSHTWEHMALCKRLGRRDEALQAAKDALVSIAELKQCMFESMLYGDQKSYEQLQRLTERSESQTADHPAPEADTPPFIDRVQEVAREISKPTRKMLGLTPDITLLKPKV
jgi:hypothetical protein